MSTGFAMRGGLLACALLLAAGAPAEAQIGGMLKRAGQRAAEGLGGSAAPAAGQTATPASAPGRGRNVVEITPAVLDGVAELAKLDAELRRFQAGRQAAENDRARAREAREVCSERHEEQAEAYVTRMASRIQEAQRKGDQKTMMALADSMQAFQAKLMQANAGECGADPAGPSPYEQERDLRERRDQKLAAIGLTQVSYGVVVERVVPFCRTGARAEGGDGARIPGQGRGIFYVYTPAEAEAIAPRCEALLPLLQQSL